jgi:hypothetical protein
MTKCQPHVGWPAGRRRAVPEYCDVERRINHQGWPGRFRRNDVVPANRPSDAASRLNCFNRLEVGGICRETAERKQYREAEHDIQLNGTGALDTALELIRSQSDEVRWSAASGRGTRTRSWPSWRGKHDCPFQAAPHSDIYATLGGDANFVLRWKPVESQPGRDRFSCQSLLMRDGKPRPTSITVALWS